MKRILTVLIALCMGLMLAACAPLRLAVSQYVQERAEWPHRVTEGVSIVKPEPSGDPVLTPEPSIEPSAGPDEGEQTLPVEPSYVFGTPLGETETVEDSCFGNAAFLGDSRTDGLRIFGDLRQGDYFCATGMNVFLVDNPNYFTFEVDGETLTMIGALGKKSYDAVYIMMGVNELGCATSSYARGLEAFLDKVLTVQPDAVIYLQTIPPVNEDMVRLYGMADYVNNDNIERFNQVIADLAAEKKVVLLDTAEAYLGEDGQLPADLTGDGCHFTKEGYNIWTDYLRCHVMDQEEYNGLRVREEQMAAASVEESEAIVEFTEEVTDL